MPRPVHCRCVPSSADLWLALAKLETYENAQRVLNQARQAVPAEPSIWIAAAKLEEARGKVDMVTRIIPRAIKALSAQQVSTSREAWLKLAEEAEVAAAPVTAAAIARATADLGVDEVDRRRTWTADVQVREGRGCAGDGRRARISPGRRAGCRRARGHRLRPRSHGVPAWCIPGQGSGMAQRRRARAATRQPRVPRHGAPYRSVTVSAERGTVAHGSEGEVARGGCRRGPRAAA
jgi:hypothetical protein